MIIIQCIVISESYTIKEELEDMFREKTSCQTAIVLNVLEGKPISVSSLNITGTIPSKTGTHFYFIK